MASCCGSGAVQVTVLLTTRRRDALGALDVLGLRGRGLGHVHRAATDHRAAGSVRHEFRKGHPNRHKLCSLLPVWERPIRQPWLPARPCRAKRPERS
jgi:hypothetical protein